jgi:WD40 repeat protein
VVDHRPQALILRGHAREISDAIWSPDGKLVATASSDQTVKVWDSQTGELLSTSTCPGPVGSVLFSKDSLKLLMAIYGAGGARICETRSGRVLVHLTDPLAPHQVFRLANWSPDESIVVAATQDSVLRWNAHSGDALDRIAMATAGYTPGYSRGAGLICTSTGTTSSSICRVDDRSTVSELNDHLKNVIHCVLSRDGRFVALAAPSSAQVWETLTGRLICRLAGEQEYINSIEFSCNGERLITAGGEPDPVGRIWDTTSGRLLGELRGHVHAIGSARFSSDGQLIVTSRQDNTARLWRADACRTIAILRGHSDLIFDARFCPDNQRILTSSADCTARIVDVSLSRSPAELMQMARARLPRQLTADEAAQFLH